ncbi:MAG: PQQ-dependent sugar dehydrogenase [Phycisphaerales bacterium]|nr:PQQ-dependent sugar dehydrogenase [Phycisphaerales bacterium]
MPHLASLVAIFLTVFCTPTMAQPEQPVVHPGADTKLPLPSFTVETVATGLEVPWAIAFLPDNRVLVTERPGRVRLVENGKLDPNPLFTVPDVVKSRGGEIGLMAICLHPDFKDNRYVYLSYGHTDKDVRVVRYTFDPAPAPLSADGAQPGDGLVEPTVIVKGIPASVNHAGCRIAFGPDKKLYVTTGEMFKRELAQDMTSLGGKTLRLNDDGSIPHDNPFLGEEHVTKGVRPEIWSFGHRNPQGMDWQPGTNLMFQSEHGPSGELGRGGDEVNAVEAGKNYGWPIIHHDESKPGLESPLVEWSPAVAPASGVFYDGELFPDMRGNFLVGALGGLVRAPTPGIIRVVLDGRKVVACQWLATEYGRVREVVVGPDGAIYFTTSNRDGRGRVREGDDKVMRLVPKKN